MVQFLSLPDAAAAPRAECQGDWTDNNNNNRRTTMETSLVLMYANTDVKKRVRTSIGYGENNNGSPILVNVNGKRGQRNYSSAPRQFAWLPNIVALFDADGELIVKLTEPSSRESDFSYGKQSNKRENVDVDVYSLSTETPHGTATFRVMVDAANSTVLVKSALDADGSDSFDEELTADDLLLLGLAEIDED